MDNQVIEKVLKEHETRIQLLANKVKWLEKERVHDRMMVKALTGSLKATQDKLDNLKESDVRRMV